MLADFVYRTLPDLGRLIGLFRRQTGRVVLPGFANQRARVEPAGAGIGDQFVGTGASVPHRSGERGDCPL